MIALKLLSPEAVLLDQEVDTVFLPGRKSPFQVLQNHAPLISSLDEGNIVWRIGDKEDSLRILSGFVQVRDNTVTACVEV